jgi:methionyl-tRNA formyltransferase
MKKINFGKIERVILFGGGQVNLETAKILKKNNIEVFIFLSKSQSLDKNNFEKKIYFKILLEKKIKFKILKSLKEKNKWQPYLTKKTLGISNTCRWIFDKKDILLFNKKLINIHNSELPSFAGGGGISWNLMMGEISGGITIHFIDQNIDTGKIIFRTQFKFPKNSRHSLDKMNKFAISFEIKQINNFLKNIINKKDFIIKNYALKNNNKASYWPRLKTEENSWINWNWDAKDICNFVNAFGYPYSGARTYFNKEIIKLTYAKLARSNLKFHPFQNGIIYRINNNNIFVACAKGGIIFNKKDFNKKFRLLGQRLNTPYRKLEKAFEIKYIK